MKFIIFILCSLLSLNCIAQSDTLKKDSLDYYGRIQYGLGNDVYSIINAEAGISIPGADIGLLYGRCSDSITYGLFKINMLCANYSKMFNELGLGIGKTNIPGMSYITDLNSTIMYDFGEFQLGVNYGTLDVFGKHNSSNMSYFNFVIRIGDLNQAIVKINGIRTKKFLSPRKRRKIF